MKDLQLYIGKTWKPSFSVNAQDVMNPTISEMPSRVPITSRDDVNIAVEKNSGSILRVEKISRHRTFTPLMNRSVGMVKPFIFKPKLSRTQR